MCETRSAVPFGTVSIFVGSPRTDVLGYFDAVPPGLLCTGNEGPGAPFFARCWRRVGYHGSQTTHLSPFVIPGEWRDLRFTLPLENISGYPHAQLYGNGGLGQRADRDVVDSGE